MSLFGEVSSNCSNKVGIEGNTNSQSPKVNPAKLWSFTLHNYGENHINFLINFCENRNVPINYIFAKELGASGKTPHLQGYFEFSEKVRPKNLLVDMDDWEKVHWETAGTKIKGRGRELKIRNHNINYCLKERLEYYTNFKIAKPLATLPCEDPEKQFPWQKLIIEIVRGDPCDRTIYWFKGDGNNGKTTFCKHLHRKFGAICLGGKSADMKNGIIEYKKKNGYVPEFIVINLPKSFNKEYLSYTGIEECKDMFFYSGKYEGDMCDGNPPHMIIFSNEFPDLDEVVKDRWAIYDIDKNKWRFKDGKYQ